MGVILDILGSMAVRGTIVLVMLSMNLSLHNTLYRKTSQAVVEKNLSYTTDALMLDLKLIGLSATSTPMITADPAEIKFLGDVDGSGIQDTVNFYLGSTSELASTDNPNDRKLYRKLGNRSAFDFASGVTNFQFEYYDVTGHPTTILSAIKSVKFILKMEHGYAYDSIYPSGSWETQIFPPNL